MKKSELMEENARLRKALEDIKRYASLRALPEFPDEVEIENESFEKRQDIWLMHIGRISAVVDMALDPEWFLK